MINHLLTVLGLVQKNLSNKEKLVMEIIIFKHICSELRRHYDQEIILSNKILINKEEMMTDVQIISRLVNDLLTEEEYSIEGIATYTGYPKDVIYELACGINRNPTFELANKVIELHFFAKRELYVTFLKKFM